MAKRKYSWEVKFSQAVVVDNTGVNDKDIDTSKDKIQLKFTYGSHVNINY